MAFDSGKVKPVEVAITIFERDEKKAGDTADDPQ